MNCIINLNKPKGITSQSAVTRVKRLLGAKKAGHSGTLDPMATGVLLVCIGEATKIMRFLTGRDKRYNARIVLGARTDTQDADGVVVETKMIPELHYNDVTVALRHFIGKISQTPPMYSAIKINGETLYKLARKGIEIQRPARYIEIYDIRVKQVDLPYIDIDVSCSKGTYIRTLCEDIGVRLGTCAHLAALERTEVGGISIDTATSLESIENDPAASSSAMLSVEDVLADIPEITVSDAEYAKALNGVPVSKCECFQIPDRSYVKLMNHDGKMFGIGFIDSNKIAIERILKI